MNMDENELKEIILRTGPNDVIEALLFEMPSKFRADEKAIHETITELAKKWPDLFGWFGVTSNYPFPFSRRLEKTLDDLGENHIISALNPSFMYYEVSERAKATISKCVKIENRFTKEQRDRLKEAAELLKQATSVDEQVNA